MPNPSSVAVTGSIVTLAKKLYSQICWLIFAMIADYISEEIDSKIIPNRKKLLIILNEEIYSRHPEWCRFNFSRNDRHARDARDFFSNSLKVGESSQYMMKNKLGLLLKSLSH